jgi:hypothetical protein
MRARLFSTSPQRQRPRLPRRGPRRRSAPPRPPRPAAERQARAADVHTDVDVERVQHAGGPLDMATYTCACGYLFVAPVSTTVSCPHCGSDQAW